MDKYKPGYLGKVIPANDPSKLTDFVTNKYPAFSKIYDTVKTESANITDVKTVDTSSTDSSTLSVKITTDKSTVETITKKVEDSKDSSVTVSGDVITAKS